jgi:hypothetical protein
MKLIHLSIGMISVCGSSIGPDQPGETVYTETTDGRYVRKKNYCEYRFPLPKEGLSMKETECPRESDSCLPNLSSSFSGYQQDPQYEGKNELHMWPDNSVRIICKDNGFWGSAIGTYITWDDNTIKHLDLKAGRTWFFDKGRKSVMKYDRSIWSYDFEKAKELCRQFKLAKSIFEPCFHKSN